jgi:GDPmannose 4,6-dehydratase
MESYPSLFRIVQQICPDECYHLAAQSFVSYSFDDEFSTINTNINGTHYMLSALREMGGGCRFYFAGSSEMFGKVNQSPQNELTPFHPRSPYGISKVAGYYLTQNYREAYGMFACSGILFNHESERRGHEFVSRKITSTVARIKFGLADHLTLGNLDSLRDWGYSPEYVCAMWLMLQQPAPDDYVVATGQSHSVREFVVKAFDRVGLDWEKYVVLSPTLFRPAEVCELKGDAAKARNQLGWQPEVTFDRLIERMIRADLETLSVAAPESSY